MNNKLRRTLMALAGISLATLTTGALAQPAAGTLSADELLDALVQQGVIDRAKAEEIKQRSARNLRNNYGAPVERTQTGDANKKPDQDGNVVRVPYVPQYIRDEIRGQVRMELKEDVVSDVMTQAKKEGWGLPNTQEDWTKTIKWSGDIRVRAEGDMYASDNATDIPDFRVINKNKKQLGAITENQNTEEDRYRLRLRARLGLKAKPVQGVEIGMRLVTGSVDDPVSTNQTMGNSFKKDTVSFDRAYFKYSTYNKDWEFYAGRMANPWFSTDLVWDTDVNFDGVAAKWYYLRDDNPLVEMAQWDPYVTIGVFPLEEFELSSKDKWLYGFQTGVTYTWFNQNNLQVSLGYYRFKNTQGVKNPIAGSDVTDFTAPGFMQRGNSVFDIRTELDNDHSAVYALAAEYREANLTMQYDIANFAPYHVYLIADYVKNIGYDSKEVSSLVPLDPSSIDSTYDKGDEGYQFKVAFGWPVVAKRGDWQVGLAYKYLERDAVLDAYTDSDFHLGGTDAKGIVLEGSYGILDNTSLSLKYLSASEIDLDHDTAPAPEEGKTRADFSSKKYSVDVIQIDLNSTF